VAVAGALATKGTGGDLIVEAVAALSGSRAAQLVARRFTSRASQSAGLKVVAGWRDGGRIVRLALELLVSGRADPVSYRAGGSRRRRVRGCGAVVRQARPAMARHSRRRPGVLGPDLGPI
jgi:hypothetical protein